MKKESIQEELVKRRFYSSPDRQLNIVDPLFEDG
jgi:hypothetical protein